MRLRDITHRARRVAFEALRRSYFPHKQDQYDKGRTDKRDASERTKKSKAGPLGRRPSALAVMMAQISPFRRSGLLSRSSLVLSLIQEVIPLRLIDTVVTSWSWIHSGVRRSFDEVARAFPHPSVVALTLSKTSCVLAPVPVVRPRPTASRDHRVRRWPSRPQAVALGKTPSTWTESFPPPSVVEGIRGSATSRRGLPQPHLAPGCPLAQAGTRAVVIARH